MLRLTVQTVVRTVSNSSKREIFLTSLDCFYIAVVKQFHKTSTSYLHMPTYGHTPRHISRTAHLKRDVCDVPSYMKIYFAVADRFVRFWASGEQSSQKWAASSGTAD